MMTWRAAGESNPDIPASEAGPLSIKVAALEIGGPAGTRTRNLQIRNLLR